MFRQGKEGRGRHGLEVVCLGSTGRGLTRQAGLDLRAIRHGTHRLGIGMAGRGRAWRCTPWQAWIGRPELSWQGLMRHGMAGTARLIQTRLGMASQAGQRWDSRGSSRHGMDGMAGGAASGRIRMGMARLGRPGGTRPSNERLGWTVAWQAWCVLIGIGRGLEWQAALGVARSVTARFG